MLVFELGRLTLSALSIVFQKLKLKFTKKKLMGSRLKDQIYKRQDTPSAIGKYCEPYVKRVFIISREDLVLRAREILGGWGDVNSPIYYL